MNKFIAKTNWADPTMIFTLILLVGLIAMMLYSTKRRKTARAQVEKMLDELRPGQRVRTVGGIIGRIKEIREESPQVKTVLLQTGSDKYPAYMLFDIQAIYGIFAEEGHTIDGAPLMKLPAPEDKKKQNKQPAEQKTQAELNSKTEQSSPASNISELSDLNAREYVDKRNALASKNKKTK